MAILGKIFRGGGGRTATPYDERHDEFMSGEWWGAKGSLAKFYEFMREYFVKEGALSNEEFEKVLRAVSSAVEAFKKEPHRINKTRNELYRKRKQLKGLYNTHYLLYYYGVSCFLDSLKHYRPTTEPSRPEEDVYMKFCKEQFKRHTFGVSDADRRKFNHFVGFACIVDDNKEWNKRNK